MSITWETFYDTGNIEAYLMLRQLEDGHQEELVAVEKNEQTAASAKFNM